MTSANQVRSRALLLWRLDRLFFLFRPPQVFPHVTSFLSRCTIRGPHLPTEGNGQNQKQSRKLLPLVWSCVDKAAPTNPKKEKQSDAELLEERATHYLCSADR